MTDAFAVRLGVAVLALAGGAVVGTAAVLLHGYLWGLALGLAATIAVLVAVPGGWWRRLPFALGWCSALLLLSVERPEGDVLLVQDLHGYLLLAAGVVVLCGGVIGLVDRREPDPVVTESDPPTS